MTEPIKCPHCGSDDLFAGRAANQWMCGSCGKKFTPEQAAPVQPMRFLISYGRPEAEICRRIKAALEQRGHTVWFDETDNKAGQDWRASITRGVASSNGVLACLSKHSVRDPGACLEELSIAVGIQGGNIHTVLLEPEREVRPPASVSHLQWLDMSDWRCHGPVGSPEFEAWFAPRMEQLAAVLESPESQAFSGWFSRMFPDLEEYRARCRPALGLVMASPTPLPAETLRRLLGWSRDELNDFVLRMEVHLCRGTNEFGDETLSFSHKDLADWLGSREAGFFRCDLIDAYLQLTDGMQALFQAGIEELSLWEAAYLPVLMWDIGADAALTQYGMERAFVARVLEAGDHCRTRGKLEDALRHYETLQRLCGAVEANRGTPDDLWDLSVSCERMGDVFQAQGRLEDALALYEEARELEEHLVKRRGTPDDLCALGICCMNVADALNALGRPDEALARYRESLAHFERLAEQRGTPDDLNALRIVQERIAELTGTQRLPKAKDRTETDFAKR
ncbi:MAG: TIR domain-containing protein [Oscillospiraceae bacterium]|nr:TIR domain-containing protein [Oscillospiraceae bacterium]